MEFDTEDQVLSILDLKYFLYICSGVKSRHAKTCDAHNKGSQKFLWDCRNFSSKFTKKIICNKIQATFALNMIKISTIPPSIPPSTKFGDVVGCPLLYRLCSLVWALADQKTTVKSQTVTQSTVHVYTQTPSIMPPRKFLDLLSKPHNSTQPNLTLVGLDFEHPPTTQTQCQ